MKKFLLCVAIGAFGACNNNAGNPESAVDSSTNRAVDSIKEANDSITEKLDSLTDKKIDSLKAKADTIKQAVKHK